MQHLKSDLIHSIALAFRDFPDSVVLDHRSEIQLNNKKTDQIMVFFSDRPVSDIGMQLMHGALTKGLQFTSEQYQIIVGVDNLTKFLDSKQNSNTYIKMVLFGSCNLDQPWALVTDTAEELASDPAKKKIFWSRLKLI